METTDMQAIRKALNLLYHVAYRQGHHDTVEGCYTDVLPIDRFTFHEDAVTDLLQDEELSILDKIDKSGEGACKGQDNCAREKARRLGMTMPVECTCEVMGTGMVLTEQQLQNVVNYHDRPNWSRTAALVNMAQYLSDRGYLSAPAKAPAGLVEEDGKEKGWRSCHVCKVVNRASDLDDHGCCENCVPR